MKTLIVFPLAVLLLAAADAPPSNPPASPAPARAAAALPAGVPAGAVAIGPNSYRYTRPDGKTWLYHNTPFGIMSAEEKPAPRGRPSENLEQFKAAADGDMIRFERATPLGIFHWQKKESELNEMEQAVWARDRSRAASAQD